MLFGNDDATVLTLLRCPQPGMATLLVRGGHGENQQLLGYCISGDDRHWRGIVGTRLRLTSTNRHGVLVSAGGRYHRAGSFDCAASIVRERYFYICYCWC